MEDLDDRIVGSLKVRIDRCLCVGFGDCISSAPRAFDLGDDGVVRFVDPDSVERERLLEACNACPVDALTVWDDTGTQIVP